VFGSRGHSWVDQHGEVAFLGFGRRDVADGLQEPAIVEPVHPLEGRELDGLEVPPGPTTMNDLSLVEAIDRLGEGVVVRVADAPTEGSMPASARRSVYLIETYWAPRSL
jgi:hypothetical protein